VAEQIHAMFADLWPDSLPRIEAGLAKIKAALEGGSRDDARFAAHKLVGTLGTYGLCDSAELARAIKEGFDDGGTEELRPLYERLARNVSAVAT
jgi:HPt (histidine-containing phosphotransfer) domain-containing protein